MCSVLFALDLNIKLPTSSIYEMVVASSLPTEQPVGEREFDSNQISFSVSELATQSYVILINKKSNEVAWSKISAIKSNTWNVKESEWRILSLVVEVTQGGQPLNDGEAVVTNKEGAFKRQVKNGKATFFGLSYGEVSIQVNYKSPTGMEATPVQKLVLDRQTSRNPIAIAVPGKSVAPAAALPAESKRNPIVGFFVWFLALVLAAVILFWIIKMLKASPDKVSDKLRSMGVPIPDDHQSDNPNLQPEINSEPIQPPIVPEGTCPFCGEPFDSSGNCKCTHVATKAISIIRLVGQGINKQLESEEFIIGREGDLQISEPTVSRKHLKVRIANGQFFVEDLGSANGTFVNGKKIDSEIEIKVGDTIQLGNFVIRCES